MNEMSKYEQESHMCEAHSRMLPLTQNEANFFLGWKSAQSCITMRLESENGTEDAEYEFIFGERIICAKTWQW